MRTKLHEESAWVLALCRMYRSQSARSIRPRSLRKKRRTSSYMDRARDALTAADASAMGSISDCVVLRVSGVCGCVQSSRLAELDDEAIASVVRRLASEPSRGMTRQ